MDRVINLLQLEDDSSDAELIEKVPPPGRPGVHHHGCIGQVGIFSSHP